MRELLISEFLSTPWALMPERLTAFAAMLARWEHDLPRTMSAEEIARKNAAVQARRDAAARNSKGAIAVLPVYGVLTQRGNMVDDVSGPGSTSTGMLSAAIREAVADDMVGSIVLDVDSPGGSVYGIGELADAIYQARAKKPVVAVANSLAASAAYWLASQASEMFATPGGEVGSIGVFSAHRDLSKAYETAGIKTTLVSAGKFKTEGSPYGPLGDEAKAFMQSRVNDYYGTFTRAVARGRGLPVASVRDGMGQGRVLGADQALAQKMVDGVMTFDEVIDQLRRGKLPSGGKSGAGARGVTGHEAAYIAGFVSDEDFRRRTGSLPSPALQRARRDDELRRLG